MSDIGTYSFKRRAQVDLDREEISRPSLSYWQDAWYRIRTNRRTLASLFIVVFMVLVAAFRSDTLAFRLRHPRPEPNVETAVGESVNDRHRTVYEPWLDRPVC